MTIARFLKTTKGFGVIAVTILGVVDGLMFLLPLVTKVFFYDLWLYWAAAQMAVSFCCVSFSGFRAWFARAAPFFRMPKAWMISGGIGSRPIPMGKF